MNNNTEKQKIVFGGGCFWCVEAIFRLFRSIETQAGYAGGGKIKPSYEQLLRGDVLHAEVIEITYDPKIISFEILLGLFFSCHDPTSLNKQDADIGYQYRSIIFYTSQEQKQEAENFIIELEKNDFKDNMIVTKIEPLDEFYTAEEYHQNYYEKNRENPYCQIVINPKLEKITKEYSYLLKQNQ